MAKLPDMLNENEDLILALRPHWVFLIPTGALAAAGLIGGLMLLFGVDWSGFFGSVANVGAGILMLVTLGWFGWRLAYWLTTSFVLTTERVFIHEALITKESNDIALDRINSVRKSQSVIERLVGAGDITVESAAESPTPFHDIRNPAAVRKEINHQMSLVEDRRADRAQARFAAANAQAADDATKVQGSIPEQIEELSRLHQRGVISDSEFQAKKAELLDRM